MKQVLLIFTKNLIHGEVKTRLAATAGNDTAYSVYEQLIKHTVAITEYLPVDKTVFYSKSIEPDDAWNQKIYKKQIQSGNNLGARMQNAFAHTFEQSKTEVIIIGTDCFELNAEIIMKAFAYLREHDVVIGPADDGGYYLLGMKKLYPELFENISWSTSRVLEQTIAICKRNGIGYHLLQELSDIDNENDFEKVKHQLFSTKNA